MDSKEKQQTLPVFFLKITFSYVIFSATADLLEAFLRYKNVFIPQVAFGFLQNIILISTIIISAFTNYHYLVIGNLLVYVARLIVMALLAKRKGYKYIVSPKLNNAVRKITILALPVFIGSGMSQINMFVDKTLASRLPEGSISALNYGGLLMSMITGLTITIMTTIIYPKLTQASAQNDINRIDGIVSTGITLIIMIAFPCSLGAMLYNNQVVQIVYERGAFDLIATSMTALAFFYYTIGLMFASLNMFLNQVYYSMYNMRTPMIIGGIGVIINISFNLILVSPMAHSGLALATSISSIVVTILMLVFLKKKYPRIEAFKSKKKIIKIISAAIISVAASYAVYALIILQFSHIIVARVAQLGLAVGVAGVIYLVLLFAMRIDEVDLIKGLLSRS